MALVEGWIWVREYPVQSGSVGQDARPFLA